MPERPLTDDHIVALLQEGVRLSVGFSESKLSKERQDAMRYFMGELPKPLHQGSSRYVSMDVYDGVEPMKAQILEVFSANHEPVSFPPLNAGDVEAARIATAYTNYVFFRQNNGFRCMADVIHDGLIGRAGVAKIFWEEKTEEEELEMTDADLPELEAHLAQNENVKVKSLDLDETGVRVHRAVLTVERNKSQVRIECLPPEAFGISPRATSIDAAELVFHRHFRTVSQLIRDGYDPKKVKELYDNENIWLSTEPELLVRFEQTDDIITKDVLNSDQTALKTVMVYECYTTLAIDGGDKADLWKITFAGDTILDKERVSEKPFIAFVPLPRPHSFWGDNFAMLLRPLQNARTALVRSIIDHTLITNNPRYQVVKGGLANPKELMENRIGGIINVLRPDSIMAMPQAGLNPFIFSTIEMIDSDKEQRTGISRLSQGLNKDAISMQISAEMVQELVSVSQIRQKIVARMFAETFMKPLFERIYALVVENESRSRIVEVAGAWVEMYPTQWPDRHDLVVDFALGYGEKEREAQKYIQIGTLLGSNPHFARMFGEHQQYNVAVKALRAMGIKDVSNYLVNPAKLPPPPPNPMQQAELAMKQADAAMKQATARATIMQASASVQDDQQARQLEAAKVLGETQRAQQQTELARMQFLHQMAVDAAEIALQRDAEASGNLEGIAKPK